MLYWIPYAFVRITVFFIAGIVLGIIFPELIPPFFASALLLILILSYFAITIVNRKKQRLFVNPGLLGLSAVFFAGYLNIYLTTESNYADHISRVNKPVEFYKGVVAGFGQEKEKSWKETIQLMEVRHGNTWTKTSGKILVYLPKRDFPVSFRYGDVLLIKGAPHPVPPPSNPGEFDYQTFLSYKNITHQQFISADDVMLINNNPQSKILSFSIDLRKWAEAKLKAVVSGAREQAIACALVLGVTDGLDNELMGAYAATGALHVLSVSGLHVGILYLLLMLFCDRC